MVECNALGTLFALVASAGDIAIPLRREQLTPARISKDIPLDCVVKIADYPSPLGAGIYQLLSRYELLSALPNNENGKHHHNHQEPH